MSKKMKKAAKQPAKKVTKKMAGKKAAPRSVSMAALASVAAAPYRRTTSATIFVFETTEGTRVRTSPQLLSCAPGNVEWTVVNLSSDTMPDVDITWPNDSPWGGAPINIRNGNVRKSFDGAKQGRFKYNVTCNGYTEDPEIEWPEN